MPLLKPQRLLFCLFCPGFFLNPADALPQSSPPIKFERISLEEGLSQNNVLCILQDSRGFMWFGTEIGLNKYDGYRFSTYKNDPFVRNSLSDDHVSALCEDQSGDLWIGTSGGLNLLDRETDRFTHYRHDPADPHSLSNDIVKVVYEDRSGALWIGANDGLNRLDKTTGRFTRYRNIPGDASSLSDNEVKCIYEDRSGVLWIGTDGGGLNRMDRATGKFESFTYQANDPFSISGNDVNTIYEDHQGMLWVGTDDDGLNRFDPQVRRFYRYRHDPAGANSISSDKIRAVWEDRQGNLWVGVWGGGLQLLDRTTQEFHHYQHDNRNPISISDNEVTALYEDRSGVVWVGTWSGGLNRFSPEPNPFLHFQHQEGNPNSLSGNHVKSICEDQSGMIWIGTWGNGLNRFDPQTRRFTHYPHRPGDPNTLSGDDVNVVFEDRQGRLWIGADDGQLDRLSEDRKQFRHFRRDRRNPHSLSDNEVRSIYQDRNGSIWIGTWGGGLNRFDEATEQFTRYRYDPSEPASLSSDRITAIIEDHNGHLWIGSWGGGLNRMDRKTGLFTRFQHEQDQHAALSDNFITCLFVDQAGTLWIGTRSGGLNKLIRSKDGNFTFEHFRTEDGLSNDAVMGILQDEEGMLWISTVDGLNKFDPSAGDMSLYDALDGLQSDQFDYAACRSRRTGALMFGGINGFSVFAPEEVKNNPYVPPVVITQLRRREYIDGKYVIIEDRSIADKQEITLPFKSNILEFEFAALNYRNPSKNQYAYQLIGLNEAWVYQNEKRDVQFTNLPPGVYTLRVKASNNHGVWNEEGTTLKITIQPPWFRTWWAYLIYGLVFAAALFGIYRFQLNRRLAENETQRLRELDAFKSRLYTYITHEFRTPITIIQGMLDAFRDSPQEPHRKAVAMIQRNSARLLNLVNQMLDLARLESGSMKLNLEQNDLMAFLKYVTESFQSLAAGKNLQLTFFGEPESCLMDYDPDKMMKVLSNLLSNAVKFTPEGGEIKVHAAVSGDEPKPVLLLKIADTGVGIDPEALPHIFNRFYRVEKASKGLPAQKGEGSGIGLALTRELVHLMNGYIEVTSTPGAGTEFIIRLPISQNAPLAAAGPATNIQNLAVLAGPEEKANRQEPPAKGKQGSPLVLIIEDNPDVVHYLRSCLEAEYHIIVAVDGQEGVEKAIEKTPDLIVSDVMMPKKDGFEVCAELKNDERTSHIPIVLLTAKAAIEDRIEGLERGADAYLAKPFHREELLVRLKKLLELRRKLQGYYLRLAGQSTDNTEAPAMAPEQKTEDTFVQRVREVVNQHLLDTDFSVEQLCREMAMSNSQLHRKLTALTGYSASRFIRYIRLTQAKTLLRDTDDPVVNIAYDSGFSDPNYFSRSFKKEFGITPSDFREGIVRS
jgi:signal transduction histidine kinase/ligand-binding sensor domain-containing protein/DNA-binding response OmpR family regulator